MEGVLVLVNVKFGRNQGCEQQERYAPLTRIVEGVLVQGISREGALRKLCCQAGESGESKAFKSSFTLLVVALLVFGRPKSPASICALCVALLVHQLPTKV